MTSLMRFSLAPATLSRRSRQLHLAASRRLAAPHVVVSSTGIYSQSLHSWATGTRQHQHQQKPSSLFQESRRSVFIQTENTPNPESLKFVPSNTIVLDNSEDDLTGYYVTHSDPQADILRSPLAKELFRIEGVKAVYLGNDFVTVTKFAQNKWQILRPEVFSTLMDFFDSGKQALLEQPEITDTTILDDDDEVVAMIKELIEARIRPAVQEDGGDIRYVGFVEETGIVTVQLAGSCVGCPSSSVTLKNGVENMLMHYIPEVTGVEALEEEEDEGEKAPADVQVEQSSPTKAKSYEERLAAAGIPFSD